MQKIKQFLDSDKGKDFLIILIVILIGLASFELGRLSKEGSLGGLKIEYNGEAGQINESGLIEKKTDKIPLSANLLQSSTSYDGKGFFASKRGNKYYSLGCSAGKNIKQENRIYFETAAWAEGAGYELSSSCR
jgi:hypothetical protein